MATALLSIESEYLPERQRLVLALGQTLSIGSSRLAHFQIPDPALKAIHLRLTLSRGGVFMETATDEDLIQLGDRNLPRARIADNGQLQFQSVRITVSTFGLEPLPVEPVSPSSADNSDQLPITGPHDTAKAPEYRYQENVDATTEGQDFVVASENLSAEQSAELLDGDDFNFEAEPIGRPTAESISNPDDSDAVVPMTNHRRTDVAESLPNVLEEKSTENADDESSPRGRLRGSVERPNEDDHLSMTIVLMQWSVFRAGFWDYRVSPQALEFFGWLIPPDECRLISPQPIDSDLLRRIGHAPGIHIYQANSIESILSDIADANYVVLATRLSDALLTEHVIRLKSTFQSAFSFLTKMAYASDAAVLSRMQQISVAILPRDDGDFSLITRMAPVEFIAAAAHHRLAIVERPAN